LANTIISLLVPIGRSALGAATALVGSALVVFVALPISVRSSIPGIYSDFEISVSGPAHYGERLTYSETLQVSFLVVAIQTGFAALYSWLHLTNGLLGLIQLPFEAVVVYPVIAAAVVRVPFRGFRIFIRRNPTHAETALAVTSPN
jgi:hypothetical protein